MVNGVEQIDTTVYTVNNINMENKKQIEQLILVVSRFKVA
jgi:hypothetical protein